MIKIYKDWNLVYQEDVDNTEDNQKKVFGVFIADQKIKVEKSSLPLLDLYTKTLRENWYSSQWF